MIVQTVNEGAIGHAVAIRIMDVVDEVFPDTPIDTLVDTGLFFIGMLVFDLATTAINNYMDYQKAHSKTYKYQENVIGRTGIGVMIINTNVWILDGLETIFLGK